MKHAVGQNGVDKQRDRIRNNVKNPDSSDPKAQRRQRSEKQRRAEQGTGLARGRNPWLCALGKVPYALGVYQKHAHDDEEECQKPKECTRIARAQIKMPKGRQQEGCKDQRRHLVRVSHGSRESPFSSSQGERGGPQRCESGESGNQDLPPHQDCDATQPLCLCV